MRPTIARVALAFVLLIPACARAAGAREQGSPAPDDAVVLQVTNNTWTDVDVYVVASSVRARMGTVTSQGTVAIPLPRDVWVTGSLQVRVDPIGGAPSYVTDRIDIHGGQRIALTVEHQTGMSNWIVENLNRW